MTTRQPIFRPADLRKAVSEWAAQGFVVQIAPDGSLTVTPPQQPEKRDQFDLVDFSRET